MSLVILEKIGWVCLGILIGIIGTSCISHCILEDMKKDKEIIEG
jgi:hypothetical protein